MPTGWRTIVVDVQRSGNPATSKIVDERMILCPSCYALFRGAASRLNISFSSAAREERQPEDDPTAVRLGGRK
jgi:hypothetical protein